MIEKNELSLDHFLKVGFDWKKKREEFLGITKAVEYKKQKCKTLKIRTVFQWLIKNSVSQCLPVVLAVLLLYEPLKLLWNHR